MPYAPAGAKKKGEGEGKLGISGRYESTITKIGSRRFKSWKKT